MTKCLKKKNKAHAKTAPVYAVKNMLTEGGGGSKNPINVLTKYMNGPLLDSKIAKLHSLSLNLIINFSQQIRSSNLALDQSEIKLTIIMKSTHHWVLLQQLLLHHTVGNFTNFLKFKKIVSLVKFSKTCQWLSIKCGYRL